MIKAVIFDRDGVLMDSNKLIISAYQQTGRELGYKVPNKEFFRNLLGIINITTLETAYGKGDGIVLETYLKIWRKLRTRMKVMPGLKSALDKIEIKKAIATSGGLNTTKIMLKSLVKEFDSVVTMEDSDKHKPNPEPLLLACKRLKVKPSEAVYVGDTVIDYKTARAAGTKFIAFLSNGSTKKELKQAGVKTIVKSWAELPKAVNEV